MGFGPRRTGKYKKCVFCLRKFYVSHAFFRQKYCSQQCMGLDKRGKPIPNGPSFSERSRRMKELWSRDDFKDKQSSSHHKWWIRFKKRHPHRYAIRTEILLNNCKGGKRQYYYKDHVMRSSWEVKFAEFLDKYKIKYEYECRRLKCSSFTYLPDFLLVDYRLFVEVKGWWMDKAIEKIDRVAKHYKSYDFCILNEDSLVALGVL